MSFRKKNKIKVKQKNSRGAAGLSLQFIIAMGIIGAVFFIRDFVVRDPAEGLQEVNVVLPTPTGPFSNLQLYTFGYITPTPQPPPPDETSSGSGSVGGGKGTGTGFRSPTRRKGLPMCGGPKTHVARRDNCECWDYAPLSPMCNQTKSECDKDGGVIWGGRDFGLPDRNFCAYPDNQVARQAHLSKFTDKNCPYVVCVAKPIIYLYPREDTLIDVKVTAAGEIFISDPLYPEGGWQDVLAHPNGTLEYNGRTYDELFYESATDHVNQPKDGLIIAREQLEPKLSEIITKLGLVGREHDEFLEYWVPTLQKLDAPYILFSILDEAEKERVDHVDISPRPDTFIAFIAYFKPLESPVVDNIKPLVLPQTPPQRVGFTAVEWGGAIDK